MGEHVHYKNLPSRLPPARHFHSSDDSLEMTNLQTGHVLHPDYQVDVAMEEIVDMAAEIATDSLV